MTKHAFGVYSTDPVAPGAPEAAPAPHALPIADTSDGPAEIAAYTVVHGRGGEAEWGLVIGDLADGSRCYGRVLDGTVLDEMEREEWVGRTVEFRRGDSDLGGAGSVNLVIP